MNKMLELLTPGVVRLKQPVENWEQAIRLAGGLLVENGDIQEAYVEQSVEAAKNMGAYFVVRPSVALSHARPGEDVNRVCLSMVTLDPPIAFGHPDNDPVSLLFMFGTQDNQAHLDLLRDIAKLLCNDSLVEEVLSAESYTQLFSLLKEKL